jgi:hypothetical protein
VPFPKSFAPQIHLFIRRVLIPETKSQELKAANYELRAFSLHQVRLLVAHVIVDVAEDCLLVFFVQAAAEFSWRTHPEGIRLDNRVLGDQGAGGDDGAGSDDGAVEDDGAHADEAAGFDFAAVEDGVVAHGDVVADVDAVLFFHAVEDAVVLNIGVVADADLVDVAAEDGVHPDAGVFAENDVADELGGVVDVAGFGELGSDAFVGADHGYLMLLGGRRMKSQHTRAGTGIEEKEPMLWASCGNVQFWTDRRP